MIKVREDLTGKTFGLLTVIKQVEDCVSFSGRKESQWLCECSCNEHNKIVVTRSNLKNGNTKSCGCLKFNKTSMVRVREDLTGQLFGRLRVLEQVEDFIKSDGRHVAQWVCECNCNNKTHVIVTGESLKYGNTKSCGCLNKEFMSQLNKKENKKDLSGEYGIIWSTNTNEKIYFDLEDAEEILKYTWFVETQGYPATHINNRMIRMHVFLNCGRYDHYNQNKLDNRRENLVFCTEQENIRNRPKNSNNTSGYTGVTYGKREKKWIAQIVVNYKNIRLGYFTNKEDAVKARLQAEAEYFGEFAPQRHLFKKYGIEDEFLEDQP